MYRIKITHEDLEVSVAGVHIKSRIPTRFVKK